MRVQTGLLLAAVLGLTSAQAAERTCDNTRPAQVFQALEELDVAGEKRLQEALHELAKQEGWSQSEWEKYGLTLSDDPAVSAIEDRRDALMVNIFTVLSHPPYDCAALDQIEDEMLELEQRQWDNAQRQVEQRLHRGGGPSL